MYILSPLGELVKQLTEDHGHLGARTRHLPLNILEHIPKVLGHVHGLQIRIHVARITDIGDPHIPGARLELVGLVLVLVEVHRESVVHYVLLHAKLHQVGELDAVQLGQLAADVAGVVRQVPEVVVADR